MKMAADPNEKTTNNNSVMRALGIVNRKFYKSFLFKLHFKVSN